MYFRKKLININFLLLAYVLITENHVTVLHFYLLQKAVISRFIYLNEQLLDFFYCYYIH